MQHTCTKECLQFPQIKELAPLQKLISVIPAQAQKGFTNFNISFTCIDVCQEFIAIGSNVGIVYLYDRKKDKLHKLRNDDYTNAVTCVKILVSIECLVVFGCKKGTVLAFKIPLNDDQIERFTVEGLHEGSVTALEWVKNGIKFFSGDSNGVVVSTEIDHFEHQSRSKILLEENSEIVQLSYLNMVLLVSTLQRSVSFNFKEERLVQIGQQRRKCTGKFGAIFYNQDENVIYASRPGQRVWKSDVDGVVLETIILKDALSNAHHICSLKQNSVNFDELKNLQFGPLKVYDSKYLMTYSEDAIVLINPELQTVTSIHGFTLVVDVACQDDEIFVLQGIRHLMRFGVHEKQEACTSESEQSSFLQDFLEPLKELSKNAPKLGTIELDEAPKVFDWLKRKFSDTALNSLNDSSGSNDVKSQRSNTTSVLPEVVQLDSQLTPISIETKMPFFDVPRTFSPIAKCEEIVFKPKKNKGKKKRKKNVQFVLGDEDKKQDEGITLHTEESNVEAMTDLEIPNDVPTIENKSVGSVQSDPIHTEDSDANENITLVLPDSSHSENNEIISNKHSDTLVEPVSPDDIYSTIKFTNSDSDNKTNHNEVNLITDNNESDLINNNNENNVVDASRLPSIIPDTDNAMTSSSNSMVSSDSSEYEVPKYGVDWIQYNAPGYVLSLSISKYHIFCVDSQNFLYVSNFPVLGLRWRKLEQPAEEISVSPSEDIIWVLYKGTIYAAEGHSRDCWQKVNWKPFARDVISMSVDDTCGWYILSNGSLTRQRHLSAVNVYSYPEDIQCPSYPIHVTCKEGVVWLLTNDSKLYCRGENPSSSLKWKEMSFENIHSICKIFLGPKHVGFIVDINDTLWFRIGVTPVTPEGLNNVWQVESSSCSYGADEPSTNVMIKSMGMLSTFFHGRQTSCIAVSEAGVWQCKQMDNMLYSNQKYVIGHSWDLVVPNGTVLSMQWKTLSSKGIVNSEGFLWGCNNIGEIFCFSEMLKNPIAVQLPGKTSVKCLEPTSESLWMLSIQGDIYIRRDMSDKCPQGVWWQLLDTSQLKDVVLSSISCSSNVVWACDYNGNVFVRIGPLNPSPTCLSQAWIQVDSEVTGPKHNVKKLSAIGKQFPLPLVHPIHHEAIIKKVYTGPKEYMVWAIDDKTNIFLRGDIASNMLIGKKWVFVPSPAAKELSISDKAVWLLKTSGEIYRRFGITRKNPAGDYWKEVPGWLSSISVTFDDDLWGLREETICQHTSYALDYSKISGNQLRTENVIEDDWEDVTTNLSDYE